MKDRVAEKPEMQFPKATPVAGETVLADRLAGPKTPGRWPGSTGGEHMIKTLQIIGFSQTRIRKQKIILIKFYHSNPYS